MSEEAPAAAPPKPPKHELLTKAEERALNALEKKAHPDLGRDFLLDKLLHVSDVSPEEERLLAALSDPANQKYGLARLCSDNGFSVARFLKFLQRAAGAQALLNSMDRVYSKGAEVAGDMMELARIRELPCRACDQLGTVTKKDREGKETIEKCESCGGRGTWTKEPTVAQQKLALQVMGVLSQAPGISIPISVNQNANSSAVSDARSASSSALVDHKFMDSLRANTDAAVRKARELKPGSVAALGPGTVIEARFNEEATAKEAADVVTRAHPEEGEAAHPSSVGGLLVQQSAGPAGSAPASAPATDSGPRAVIPQLGIPSGVRRPPSP